MNLLKVLWKAIAGFHYYMLTCLIGTILFAFLSSKVGPGLASVMSFLMYAFAGGLGIYMFVVMYNVLKNTWNDGSKILAMIYGTLVLALVLFVGYVILFAA